MTALPAAATATAVAATEGDVKTWLTNLHDYLAGLLGTDGAAATARAALGVGSVTSGAIITALGYTPLAPNSNFDYVQVYSGNLGGPMTINLVSNWGYGIYCGNVQYVGAFSGFVADVYNQVYDSAGSGLYNCTFYKLRKIA